MSLWQRLVHFLEMIRFSHTLFALPFALLAALMAWHAEPDVAFRGRDLVGILLAMVTARSAAMAFNRLADRHIDAQNPRTATRHIPAGILSPGSVALFALLAGAGFVASTLVFLPNRVPLLGSIPVLLFLLGYSYAKRFTSLVHFWLGAALMLAPVCAWLAIRGEIVTQTPGDLIPALLLGSAVLLWVAGFDIIYACQDFQFDVQSGLRSIPAKLGLVGALRLAAVCHLAMVLVLLALPTFYPQFGLIYYAGVVLVALLLAYEHSLVRPDDLARVNLAFFHVNSVVSVGLLLVGAVDVFTWPVWA